MCMDLKVCVWVYVCVRAQAGFGTQACMCPQKPEEEITSVLGIPESQDVGAGLWSSAGTESSLN